MPFKLRVVAYAENKYNRAAAQKFHVYELRVRELRAQKSELEQHSSKKKRLPGGGRKMVISDTMEEELVEWIHASRMQHLRVTCTAIQRKAATIYEMHHPIEDKAGPMFVASRGWL